MSDQFDRTDVRITVPRETSGSDVDSSLHDGLSVQSPRYLLVVPLTEALLDAHTGINVQRLLRTAVALAKDKDSRILLLGIETVSSDATLEDVREHVQTDRSDDIERTAPVEAVEERRTQVAEVAAVARDIDQDVSVSATVRVVRNLTSEVIDVADRDTKSAVLLLRGAGLDPSWLLSRSTVDTLVADAGCDVFVENVGVRDGESGLYIPDVDQHTVASLAESEAEDIDSILLPVDTGPHAALASEAARAVAHAADASVTVIHVVHSEASAKERAEGEDVLKFADYVLGSDISTTTELREADTVVDEIVQEASNHDYLSIGAPEEKSRLKELVFGSIDETITDESEATVLMARDADRTSRSLYYRWKRGVESISDDDTSEN